MKVAAAAAARSSSSSSASLPPWTAEATTSVGARSSLAAASGARRRLERGERGRAEHAEAPRVGEVVVGRPAGQLEELLERRAVDRLGVVGLVGAAAADQLVERHRREATEQDCGEPFSFRGFWPMSPRIRPSKGSEQVLRIDETSKTLVAPPAGGLVTEVSPERAEMLALVSSSWEAFAGEIGSAEPPLRRRRAPPGPRRAGVRRAGRPCRRRPGRRRHRRGTADACARRRRRRRRHGRRRTGRDPRVAAGRRARRLPPDRVRGRALRRAAARDRGLAHPPPRPRGLVLRRVGLPLRHRASALRPARVPGPRRLGPDPAAEMQRMLAGAVTGEAPVVAANGTSSTPPPGI